MPTRNAHAEWNGSIGEGTGTMALGSGAFEGKYNIWHAASPHDSGGNGSRAGVPCEPDARVE